MLRKHFADGCTRRRQERIDRDRNFNIRADAGHTEREVQSHSLRVSKRYVVAFGLKTGQLGTHFVGSGQQTNKVVCSGFIRNSARYYARGIVRCGNRHAWQYGA